MREEMGELLVLGVVEILAQDAKGRLELKGIDKITLLGPETTSKEAVELTVNKKIATAAQQKTFPGTMIK